MDDLELIKEKINIVDLISEYLPLKKAGVNFKVNCPFHQEKTPSFVVSPERQIWHCFGCQKGGDIFKFLMEKEGIDFPESLEILAQRAGVVLKNRKTKDKDQKERLYEANSKASQYYQYLLTEHKLGKNALDYLHKRGLTGETIKSFGLGYAPQNWESLTKFLEKRGFLEKELIDSGLCVSSKRGCYDRMRGRIVFPLIDVRGRIMGFSGRVLDDSLPKYVNTPQTPIFDKGRFLFGLHLAKSDIREKKEVILVEGEMDMLMSFQSGVKNIVASKGTALTQFQLDALKKYTDTLVLCFDTDLAGDEASRRGIEMADLSGFNLKVIQLEGGKDPGEISAKDPDSWKKMVGTAVPIYDYYLQSISKRYDLKAPFSKKSAFAEILPVWKKIHDPVTQDHYIQKLSALLQIKEDTIKDQLNKVLSPKAQWKEVTEAAKPTKIEESHPDRRKVLEEYLISLLLHLPQDLTYVPNFPETLFTQEHLEQIYVLLVLFLDGISFKGHKFKIAEFSKTLPPELIDKVDELYLMQLDEKLEDPKHWQKELDLVVAQLKRMLIKSSLEKLSLEIKTAQQFDKMETLEALNKRFRDLSVKLKNL